MADKKITGLTEMTALEIAALDMIPVVDVSDTTMAATGTNKKVSWEAIQEALAVSLGNYHLDLYFSNTASDQAGSIDYVMTTLPASAGVVPSGAKGVGAATALFDFFTPVGVPHLTRLTAGNYDIHAHLKYTKAGSGTNRIVAVYAQLYKLSGVTLSAVLAETAKVTIVESLDTLYDMYFNLPVEIPLETTDRLVLKFLADISGGSGTATANIGMTVGGTADPHLSVDIASTELSSTYLPYTGAESDVNLGAKNLTTTGLATLTHVKTPIKTDTVAAHAVTIDWSQGNVHKITLVGTSADAFTFSNPQAGARYLLHLIQPTGANGTVTWPANVKWANGNEPVLTTTDGYVDLVTLYYDGTTYFASYSLNFAPYVA